MKSMNSQPVNRKVWNVLSFHLYTWQRAARDRASFSLTTAINVELEDRTLNGEVATRFDEQLSDHLADNLSDYYD